VAGGLIEVYRAPVEGQYTQITQHRPGETVRPQAFDDVAVPVAEVVPRAGSSRRAP
jgi:Uma2 family endonuclease